MRTLPLNVWLAISLLFDESFVTMMMRPAIFRAVRSATASRCQFSDSGSSAIDKLRAILEEYRQSKYVEKTLFFISKDPRMTWFTHLLLTSPPTPSPPQLQTNHPYSIRQRGLGSSGWKQGWCHFRIGNWKVPQQHWRCGSTVYHGDSSCFRAFGNWRAIKYRNSIAKSQGYANSNH